MRIPFHFSDIHMGVHLRVHLRANAVDTSPSEFPHKSAGFAPDHPPATSTTNRKGGQEQNLGNVEAGRGVKKETNEEKRSEQKMRVKRNRERNEVEDREPECVRRCD